MAHNPKPLTTEQQLSLRNKAKSELQRLETIYGDVDTRERINNFKDKFEICEIVYKVILDEHQFNKTGKHPLVMKIQMTQVPFALDYAGYDFDKDLLTHLFGSEQKIGCRTAKTLRDSLTHSISQNAIDELVNREEELYGYRRKNTN